MKRIVYALVLLLIVVSGLVFANREISKDPVKHTNSQSVSVADRRSELAKWESSAEGVYFNKWKQSSEGKKVLSSAAKISKEVSTSTNMEAVITSLSLPPGSRLGFGVMAQINGEAYILSFGLEESAEFQQLRTLNVNDKIIIRSSFVSYAPKYSYPIVRTDYVEHDSEIVYKRAPRKGC